MPIPVKSRYGYALDPVFEGLFFACALLAEAGIGTTKQIDVVCKKTGDSAVCLATSQDAVDVHPSTSRRIPLQDCPMGI